MSSETIIALLKAHELTLVGDLVFDASVENKIYAFIKIERSATGSQVPTNYHLRIASEAVSAAGAEITFVLVEDDRQDILANSKAMLMRQYPNLIRNVFPTFGSRGVVIWIEPKRILAKTEIEEMRNKSQQFLEFLKVSLESIYTTASENLPTGTACLNLIRVLSPVTQQMLRQKIEARGFHIPSDEWLAHALDKLRKAKLIHRSKSGLYTMTLQGLKALGSGKHRSSPDVIRALAMARRGA